MSTRLIDWRDLPYLHNYRHQTVYLNNILLLTGGSMQVFSSLVSSVVPARGVLTMISTDAQAAEQPLMGQAIHRAGDEFAYLSFLAPTERITDDGCLDLLESLALQAGRRGAMRLLADVDEHSPALEALRLAGYAAYTRQRTWRLPDTLPGIPIATPLRVATEQDWLPIQMLYNAVVPTLVKQVEATFTPRRRGLVHYQDEKLLAYIELHYGNSGICARPFIHPDVEEIGADLAALLGGLPGLPLRRSRPMYICVTHYQSWIEFAIEELGGQPGPRKVLMTKHLTVRQKEMRAVSLPVLEQGRPETFALSSAGESIKIYDTISRN
jgi:hypothetical protein